MERGAVSGLASLETALGDAFVPKPGVARRGGRAAELRDAIVCGCFAGEAVLAAGAPVS
jgi:hypothetical protein